MYLFSIMDTSGFCLLTGTYGLLRILVPSVLGTAVTRGTLDKLCFEGFRRACKIVIRI